jgi:CheY-like chemotaxis protein
LLVEDVALSRRVIAVMLGRYGHTVSEASDGAEALALCTKRTFDLILLDLGLPDMDGLALLPRIAYGSRNAPTPVIVLTASTVGATSERARNTGAVLVLHKPVSGEDLSDAIRSVFAGQHRDAPGVSALFGAEMEILHREANAEILARGRSLIGKPETTPVTAAREAHRLAGLAAQFGAAEVAAAADRLETELCTGAAVLVALADLDAALTRFASHANKSAPQALDPKFVARNEQTT